MDKKCTISFQGNWKASVLWPFRQRTFGVDYFDHKMKRIKRSKERRLDHVNESLSVERVQLNLAMRWCLLIVQEIDLQWPSEKRHHNHYY